MNDNSLRPASSSNETLCFLKGLEHRTPSEQKAALSIASKSQNILKIIFELEEQT